MVTASFTKSSPGEWGPSVIMFSKAAAPNASEPVARHQTRLTRKCQPIAPVIYAEQSRDKGLAVHDRTVAIQAVELQ